MLILASGISHPAPRPYRHLQKDMIDKVNSKEYLLGELVEPKSFEKFVLVDGEIVKRTFTIHARRIPFKDIRKKIFEEHKKKGIKFCTSELLNCTIFTQFHDSFILTSCMF